MRLVLHIRYENGSLVLQSEPDHHVETVNATVGLSLPPGAAERIASVGQSADEMDRLLKEHGPTTTTYRFIDPFSSTSFDGRVASLAVTYWWKRNLFRVSPRRARWHPFAHWGTSLVIEIPRYPYLPESSRAEFEAGLKAFNRPKFTVAG